MALCLSLLTLLFCLFTFVDHHKPAEITGPEIFVGLAFLPMSVMAVCLFVYGFNRARTTTNRSYYLAVALLASPLALISSSSFVVNFIKDARKNHFWNQYSEWRPKAATLSTLLLRYYRQHPERFHALQAEEVRVDGFLAFCQSQPEFSKLSVRRDASQFLDFKNLPLHYYADLDNNGSIDFGNNMPEKGIVAIAANDRYYYMIEPPPPPRVW